MLSEGTYLLAYRRVGSEINDSLSDESKCLHVLIQHNDFSIEAMS